MQISNGMKQLSNNMFNSCNSEIMQILNEMTNLRNETVIKL